MLKRPNIDVASEEVQKYILHLEAQLSDDPNLVREMRLYCDALANEISELRAKGDMLRDEIVVDNLLHLINQLPRWKALNYKEQKAKGFLKSKNAVEPKNKKTNLQDFVLSDGTDT